MIALLGVWANASAAEPSSAPAPSVSSNHWAFEPVRNPAPPKVRDTAWPRTGIDRFVLAAMEARGLRPSPAASKRALIRRVTFDLTGLPPPPAEVAAFVADSSPEAWLRRVDRLLESPRYGERWGRHWLDVARYADSNGMDENLSYASAWRYRDYVVAAFNADKPYDQFVREQIAGDLLPGAGSRTNTLDPMIATGFLCIGPKMLAEDDPVKMEMDIVDEQLDTVSRAFMGLTVGCGRCHDHKFDPIPMADYYAMAGIFKSTRTMEHFKVVARWQERPLAAPEEVERLAAQRRRIAEATNRVAALIREGESNLLREARTRTGDYLRAARRENAREQWVRQLQPVAKGSFPMASNGGVVVEAEQFQRSANVVATMTGYGEGIGILYGEGGKTNFAEYDVRLDRDGPFRMELRYAAAASRPVAVFLNGKLARRDAAAKITGSWNPDTQTWETVGVFQLHHGTNQVRLERPDCIPHLDKFVLMPLAGEDATRFAAGTSGAEGSPGLIPEFVRRWATFLQRNETNSLVLTGGDELVQRAVVDPKGPFEPVASLESHDASERVSALARARGELKALEAALPALPETMAVGEGTPQDVRVHKRGSHLTLGEPTQRGVLQRIGAPAWPGLDTHRSGRLELADWLVHPGHPLTARVMVNRIWHWHFGEGLVRSTDNFGKLGELPTHPDLLDWLARRFMDSGWSIKAMHRLIVSSAVYQQAALAGGAGEGEATPPGGPREAVMAADPENRFWTRFNRRRLEAEVIRDTVLAVGGDLDLKLGGPSLPVKNREYVTGTGNKIDASIFESPRRSLYLPVVRSALYDVFQVFDFADPSTLNGHRDQTTVAPQALFMLNSRLVANASRKLAGQFLAHREAADRERVAELYQVAYGRPPLETELQSALRHLDRYSGQLARTGIAPGEIAARSWQSLCRAVLAANEFIYLD